MQKELILQNFEEKNVSLEVYVDPSKAFDTINHNTVLVKLNHYGVRGSILLLFQSYLARRYQFVSINNAFVSESLCITAGIPQDSILGSLLFLIYINDIIALRPNTVLYADDLSLLVVGTIMKRFMKQALSLNRCLGSP